MKEHIICDCLKELFETEFDHPYSIFTLLWLLNHHYSHSFIKTMFSDRKHQRSNLCCSPKSEGLGLWLEFLSFKAKLKDTDAFFSIWNEEGCHFSVEMEESILSTGDSFNKYPKKQIFWYKCPRWLHPSFFTPLHSPFLLRQVFLVRSLRTHLWIRLLWLQLYNIILYKQRWQSVSRVWFQYQIR